MIPLRVAMIAQRFWPRAGALETRGAVGRRTGRAGRRRDDRHRPLAPALARGNPLPRPARRAAFTATLWPPAGVALAKLALAARARRWLRRNADDFDVALVWGMMDEARAAVEAFAPRGGAGVSPARQAAGTAAPRVPVVLVPERTGWQGDCFRQVRTFGGAGLQRACRRAAAFVATTPAARRELEAAGYPRHRIRDVPRGVPLLSPRSQAEMNDTRDMLADANPVLRLDGTAPLVLSTTRLAPDRGWQCLLTAWSIVARHKPAARLWLAGEAPQAAAVAARIARTGPRQRRAGRHVRRRLAVVARRQRVRLARAPGRSPRRPGSDGRRHAVCGCRLAGKPLARGQSAGRTPLFAGRRAGIGRSD